MLVPEIVVIVEIFEVFIESTIQMKIKLIDF